MYQTFDESMHAFLTDAGLDDAGGGQILKHGEEFTYRLFNQPDNEENEILLELNPSITPEPKWRVIIPSDEGRKAYEAFISNPRNGQLYAE